MNALQSEVYAKKDQYTECMPEGLGPYIKDLVNKGTPRFQLNMLKGICVMFMITYFEQLFK